MARCGPKACSTNRPKKSHGSGTLRVTGCNICKNLRFAGAREAGLTEELVGDITDDFEQSDLPARYKLAVRYADVIINDPHGLSDDDKAALTA